jgi:hydrogenase large subunit
MGLTEAARGSLGHWLRLDGGGSPLPDHRAHDLELLPARCGRNPGPLEQALVGAPIRPGETEPVAVQRRAQLRPCMVCTVH